MMLAVAPIPEPFPNRATSSLSEDLFIRLIASLASNYHNNLSVKPLLACSFPQRAEHLMSHRLQEEIYSKDGPTAERLQKAYSEIKMSGMKEVTSLVLHKMESFREPEDTNLEEVLKKCLVWMNKLASEASYKSYFINELMIPFARYLHFMESSSSENFGQDPCVQSVLHLQQKFFMIDNLSTSSALDLSLAERKDFQDLLATSLKENLTDFISILESISALKN